MCRHRGGARVDALGLLVAAGLGTALVPQARQWLQLHGSHIVAVTVAVVTAGALILLLVAVARRGASAWSARRGRPESWDIRILDGLVHSWFEEAVRDLMRRGPRRGPG